MTESNFPADKPEKTYWLDRKGNVDKIFWGLVLVCGVLFCADFFYRKDTHFLFDSWSGFFAWYGFISCVGLVLLAKQLRKIVKRDEDYYGD